MLVIHKVWCVALKNTTVINLQRFHQIHQSPVCLHQTGSATPNRVKSWAIEHYTKCISAPWASDEKLSRDFFKACHLQKATQNIQRLQCILFVAVFGGGRVQETWGRGDEGAHITTIGMQRKIERTEQVLWKSANPFINSHIVLFKTVQIGKM